MTSSNGRQRLVNDGSSLHRSGGATVRWVISVLALLFFAVTSALAQEAFPVLEFPEEGMDDPEAYGGYSTRFYKDSEGNAVQVYIRRSTGRVVHLWANASNESAGFTARDAAGKPAVLQWGHPRAKLSSHGPRRALEYELRSESPSLHIGLILLGSMRVERDFQYARRDSLPLDSDPYLVVELLDLIANLERLPERERTRHLAVLNASSVDDLRARLRPQVTLGTRSSVSSVRVEHSTFDSRHRLAIELTADPIDVALEVSGEVITLESVTGRPFVLHVKVETDSPALSQLKPGEIFTDEFLKFLDESRAEGERQGERSKEWARYRWLDRQVRAIQLVSYKEKLMAGLPNFATYFGRDMMMSALMMEEIWTPSMLEHVITGVIRKLSPTGEVSHEEALGGQAIRENAAEYNRSIAEYLRENHENRTEEAEKHLARARSILGSLQSVRENYMMVDDDFQLPVVAASYIKRLDVSSERKRAFVLDPAGEEGIPRLSMLLQNLRYVVDRAHPYVERPLPANLVGFPKLADDRWFSGSWRDSGPGYAGGRFAMDVNVVWVPKALESIGTVLAFVRSIGLTVDDLLSMAPDVRDTKFEEYLRDSGALDRARKTWSSAMSHFIMRLDSAEVQRRIRAKLQWLPEAERRFWNGVLVEHHAGWKPIEFLALSLDSDGQPIPVASTDPATLLFLDDPGSSIRSSVIRLEKMNVLIGVFLAPYPVGLFVENLGPLVANDSYATRSVWEEFQKDEYHSPRVVWGREVNLLLLGLARHIRGAELAQVSRKDTVLRSTAHNLRHALEKIRAAVEASGLKHNELWSYRISEGTLMPIRYGSSSDVQLWNLTDLAVQYVLMRIERP